MVLIREYATPFQLTGASHVYTCTAPKTCNKICGDILFCSLKFELNISYEFIVINTSINKTLLLDHQPIICTFGTSGTNGPIPIPDSVGYFGTPWRPFWNFVRYLDSEGPNKESHLTIFGWSKYCKHNLGYAYKLTSSWLSNTDIK